MHDSDIILHNYPQSPVAEKVRVVFGILGLSWYNVEIPRLPPKPDLTNLTGGYRRTPVMQIGADIYCDSQCIIREIEQRHCKGDKASNGNSGLQWCSSRWSDGPLFDLSVKIVLGSAGDNLPADFAADRGRLYLGENWSAALKQANADLPHLVAQMRAPLQWLEYQLSDDRPYLGGTTATAIDAQVYHCLWFIKGRWGGGPSLLAQFDRVNRWMDRIEAIGHGQRQELSAESALITAASHESTCPRHVAEHDPQGLEVGQPVFISPDVNGGEQAVAGTVRMADALTIAIERESESSGQVVVHFPRSGYRIETQDD